MKKDQEDTLNMYESTSDVLHANNAVWGANVPFTDAVTALDAGIDTISGLRDQQETDTSGVTDDKDLKRKSLEDQTFAIGSIIAFYASTTSNRELLKKVSFTRTALSRARDNEVPGMSQQVLQAANDNAVDLLPFGITAPMIANLDGAITDYVKYISKPRAAVSETSAATEQLPKAFDDTTTVLEEQLDNGMELFRASNPDFYSAYFIAREIINSPTSKRALEVHLVDSVTHLPIEHVKMIVDSAINRRSSANGNSWVQNLSEGAHNIKASLPGYADVLQDFNVISGETTKVVLPMVKE